MSWYQDEPTVSLDMLAAAGVTPADSVLDVGGGASVLVDALLRRGYSDLTVLDISAAGMAAGCQRLEADAGRISWLISDVRFWRPERRYDAWHDRALLHFFTTEQDRAAYLRALHAATGPGATAVIATFAPHGPAQCSGLPVARYDAAGIAALLGEQWQPLSERREQHHTPAGRVQPFTWVALRRRAT